MHLSHALKPILNKKMTSLVDDVLPEHKISIHREARDGNVEGVRAALKDKVLVDRQNYHKNTALHIAAENGETAVVKFLIDAGADVNIKNNNQWTALQLAAYGGYELIVITLIRARAEVDMLNSNQRTALYVAAERGHTTIVKILLSCGAQLDLKNCTAFYIAARNGHTAVMTALFCAGADPAGRPITCWTPLIQASRYGHLEAVKLLVDLCVNINVREDWGWTALRFANYNDNISVADYLNCKGGVE